MKKLNVSLKIKWLTLACALLVGGVATAEGRSGPVTGGEAIPLQEGRSFSVAQLMAAQNRCIRREALSLTAAITQKPLSRYGMTIETKLGTEQRTPTDEQFRSEVRSYRVINSNVQMKILGVKAEHPIVHMIFSGYISTMDMANSNFSITKAGVHLGLGQLDVYLYEFPDTLLEIPGLKDLFDYQKSIGYNGSTYQMSQLIPAYSFKEDILTSKPSDFGFQIPVTKALSQLYVKAHPAGTPARLPLSTYGEGGSGRVNTNFYFNVQRFKNCLKAEALKPLPPPPAQ